MPPVPQVHLLAIDPMASETGADTATFAVYRTGSTNASLTVAYRLGGAAGNGADYETLSGSVTIPAGVRRAPITITPIDDFLIEGNESVLIGLEQPLVWPPPYIVCWPSVAVGWIEDNDPLTNQPPVVRLVNPPDGAAFLAPVDLTLVAAANDPDGRIRTVEFFDGPNSLGLVTNRPSIVRPAAQDEATLELADDLDPDLFPDLEGRPDLEPVAIPVQLFRWNWEDVPPGAHVLTAVATDHRGASTRSAPVTIRVTERPPQPVVTVRATDPVAAEGPWPTDASAVRNTATFTVHRTGPTDFPMTVFYRLTGTASNGVDYHELPHTVVIPRGARTADIVVDPLDDALVEGTETVCLGVVPPLCIEVYPPPPDCYVVGEPRAARAVILDNDLPNRPPVVQIVRPLDGSVFLAPADIAMVAQADDVDGVVTTVEFFAGTNSLGIVVHDPAVASADRAPFLLVWSNAPPGRHVLHALATDNDGAETLSKPVEIAVVGIGSIPVVSIVATDPEAAEGGSSSGGTLVNTATFTVNRTGPTEHPLAVYYSLSGTASNGVDYRLLPGRVVIPMNSASAPILVSPIDDNLVEGPETVVAALVLPPVVAPSTGPVDPYVIGADSRARAIILDNDTAPTNVPPKVAIVQPEAGDLFIAPADIAIWAEARDGDGFLRTVEFFANGVSIGLVSNSLSTISNLSPVFRFAWAGVPAGAYALTARATDNRGASGVSEPVPIRVVEIHPLPVVTLEASDPWASEGDLEPTPIEIGAGEVAFIGPPIAIRPDTATFTMRRDRGTNHALTVYYSVGGTASNGVDYVRLPGEVTIPAGAFAARLVVTPIDDNLIEGTETVIARLEPAACPAVIPPPPGCYRVGEPSRALAYIRDNDLENQLPKVDLVAPAAGSTFPAGADIEITALVCDRDGWVERVKFYEDTNQIGEEFIIFIQPPPPGQPQKFSMVWSNVPPGRYALTARAMDNRGGAALSEPVEMAVLEACRLPVVTLRAIDNVGAEHNPRLDIVEDPAIFRVTRDCRTNDNLRVFYRIAGTAENGADYAKLSGEVTLPAGAVFADIFVAVIDDTLVEGTETVELALEPPLCLATDPPPPGCYVVGRPSRDTAFIRDDDSVPTNAPPRVALINPPEGAVFVAPADILVVASASDPDGWVVTVEFFEGPNSLGIVTNNPLVLDPTRAIEDPTRALGLAGGLDPMAIDPIIRPINPFIFKWENVPAGAYELTAVATDNRGMATKSEPVHVKVADQPERTIVTVTAPDPKASEGLLDATSDPVPDTATFTVRRTGPTNFALTVFYRLSGTALNGVDYRELPNTVVIPEGERTADILVEPIDDRLVEGPEGVVLTLVEPACIDLFPPPPDCYLVGRPEAARAVIYDNDAPANEPPFVRLNEPQPGAVFRAPAEIQLVAFARDREDGYQLTVEFFEGTHSLGFGTFNPTRCAEPICPNYVLTWSNVPPGDYVLTAVATDSGGLSTLSEPVEIKVVGITPPPVVNIETIQAEGREPAPLLPAIVPVIFQVTRTGPTNGPLTVCYRLSGTASNGVDYQPLPGTVTIPAGASTARISVMPLDDNLCEGDESVIARLVPPISISNVLPCPFYLVGSNSVARGVILDNDTCPPNQPPCVALVQPQDGDVFVAPADIRVCAKAQDPDGRVVRVEFFAGTNSLGSVPGSASNLDDLFCVLWHDVRPGAYVLTAVATDDGGASARSAPVRIRVVERPPLPVVTIVASDAVATEQDPRLDQLPDTATFTVMRRGGTNNPLTVLYRLSGTASNGVDYQRLSGRVTIAAGSLAARILVDPIDDDLIEGTETVIAQLVPGCNVLDPATDACYLIGQPSQATAYIRDNETQPNVPPGVAILFPREGEVFAAPADIEITVATLDPDGYVWRVEFFEGTNAIGESRRIPIVAPPPGELQRFDMTWSNVPPGRYVLTAKATDNLGATTMSGPIHVSVRGTELPVVTIRAIDPIATEPNLRSMSPVLDTATFMVQRTGLLQLPLLVRYYIGGTASNGVDYLGLSGEVLFAAGQDSQPIVIRPLSDNLVEGTESVLLTLDQPRCLGVDPPPAGCYLVGDPGRAIAYIRDTDLSSNLPPRVAITSPYPGQTFDAPARIPILAVALDPDGYVTLVEFFAGADKIGEMSMVFIVAPPPGQPQHFSMVWSNVPVGRYVLTARATDSRGATSVSPPVAIAVEETPLIPVVTILAADAYGREGTPPNPCRFVVRRTGPTNFPINVHFAISGTASNGVDYERIEPFVTIPAGRRSSCVVVTPIDDRRPEPIETVILRLLPAALYNVGRPEAAAAIIVDNDQPRPVTLTLPDRTFHLRADAANGFGYRVECSINLRDWEPLCVGAVLDGALHFVDPDAAQSALRFYRLIPDVALPEDE